jgi:S-adenosylmethionine-dependent methyltransferase
VPDSVLWDTVCGLLSNSMADPMADSMAGSAQQPTDVLDLGGGTGGLAVPLAALGHRVTVVDSSPDALAALARRAGESGVEGRLIAVQGDADDLQLAEGAFDLALCHGLLEHVDDPAATLAGVARALRPGGRFSLVVAQRSAAVVGTALAGHLARAETLLDDPDGRWGETDPLARRFDRTQVAGLVEAAGLQVDDIHGLRVLGDLVPGQLLESDPAARSRLLALDGRLAGLADYAGLAASLHVLAHRPDPAIGTAGTAGVAGVADIPDSIPDYLPD